MGRRDEFTQKTKRILADRVAWRCSYAGCDIVTVGPGVASNVDVVNLGEAAHITAAASGGPRYDPSLTREQRQSIDNGIWMCRHHAALVDNDELNYSVDTLKQWKQLAEAKAAETLKRLDAQRPSLGVPSTLIAFGLTVIANGIWVAGDRECWRFRLSRFVDGNADMLRRFVEEVEHFPIHERFVVVESQGDGRLVSGAMRWEQLEDGAYLVTVPVTPRPSKRPPETVGSDLALGPGGDLVFEGGDLKVVSGMANALQKIRIHLGARLGEWSGNPAMGSRWVSFYERYRDDPELLKRLFKLDLARLVTIPLPDPLAEHFGRPPSAPLDFIERVERVDVPDVRISGDNLLRVFLHLVLANGQPWSGEVLVRIATALRK